MNTVGKLAVAFAAGRVAYAAALIVAPRRAGGPWLGDALERGGGRVAARALVARDALLALGLADAAVRGNSIRPWAAALVASDLTDIAATLADRDELPDQAAVGTVAVAGSAALAGAALLASSER
jgi:hypothetical protein